ncbi:MAG: UDP-N-acetylmuramate dehydrogenase [Lachnospiraceae bacterium]|nr:UDP-N-acetylmuramate dehydrogenase [Lachnospiraceae bacterium]
MSEYFYEYIQGLVKEGKVLKDEPLSKHTTFKVGGPADYFIIPGNLKELAGLISYLNKTGREYFILGKGSNLLVGDHGYRGVVINILDTLNDIRVVGEEIHVYAGALLSKIANEAQKASLSGFEFAAGIPGSAGGAVIMNAGAYGGEMADIVTAVHIISKEGELVKLGVNDLHFAYRSSILQKEALTVAAVGYRLKKGDPEEIRAKMDELKAKRLEKQPLEYPSAGSTFKRPEGYFAGKLIMDAGLGGYSVGGAQVSKKHCGFVINKGGATAADIMDLIKDVQERVKLKFGVKLEPEVKIIGEF